jgi:hypothetical protein
LDNGGFLLKNVQKTMIYVVKCCFQGKGVQQLWGYCVMHKTALLCKKSRKIAVF